MDFYKQAYSRFLDLRTGQHIASEYDDADIAVKNKTGRGCIVEIQYYGIPYVDEDGSTTIPRLKTVKAYVSFRALEDGLQKSDLLVIYEKEGH